MGFIGNAVLWQEGSAVTEILEIFVPDVQL